MSVDMNDIQELNEKGFVRSSPRLLYRIRINDMSNVKFFRPNVGASAGTKGSAKYSSIDVFGGHIVYCFDIRRKKEFVDFLVAKFFGANGDPDESIRKAFTRILHSNGLHWEGCSCTNKDIDGSDI